MDQLISSKTASHHPAPERPDTESAQHAAAVTELCKATDHVTEAWWLLPDDSPHTRAVKRVLTELRELVKTASNGRVEP